MKNNADASQQSLDDAIKQLQDHMAICDGDSEEYATMLNRLERLHKLREKSARKKVSPDTLLLVGGNLAGILIIVSYEHGRAITSKALSFAGKLR